MEAKSKEKYIRIPARKMRRVMDVVRGKDVIDAMNILRLMPYTAAKVIEKNLVCAVANAAEKFGVTSDVLKVSEIFADEGPTYKRAKPRAQGRIYRILKRTSHLSVTVSVKQSANKVL